ncbi:unnamed protein product [Effrenium voratum]|nr:unnamed protein product [Effrenium voratum]
MTSALAGSSNHQRGAPDFSKLPGLPWRQPMRSAVLLVWFGPFPPWARLTLESMRWNQGLDFLIFTDQKLDDLPENVRLRFLNASAFEHRAEAVLGIRPRLFRGYKLCDWRMAYGELFAPWLRFFDFWGWMDFDLVLGDLQRFGLNSSVLSGVDSLGDFGWPSQGPFTLLRNRQDLNTLWRQVPDVVARLLHPDIQRMNEWAFGRLLASQGRRHRLPFPLHLSATDRHRDGDIAWHRGRVWHVGSCGEAAYFHFSGWKAAFAAVLETETEAWSFGPSGAFPGCRRCADCADPSRPFRAAWDAELPRVTSVMASMGEAGKEAVEATLPGWLAAYARLCEGAMASMEDIPKAGVRESAEQPNSGAAATWALGLLAISVQTVHEEHRWRFQKLSPHESMFLEAGLTKMDTFMVSHNNLLRLRVLDFPGAMLCDENISLHPSDASVFGGNCVVVIVIDAQDESYATGIAKAKKVIEFATKRNPKLAFDVLIHKVDGAKFYHEERKVECQTVIHDKITEELAEKASQCTISFTCTSIYDHTIFEAISRVVQKLIPEKALLEQCLESLLVSTRMEKVYLFDVVSKEA